MSRAPGEFFGNDAVSREISPKTVRIYKAGRVPRKKFRGYEEMTRFVPNAYPIDVAYDNIDTSDGTRAYAVWVVAHHYHTTIGEAIRCFDICVIPGPRPRGFIYVKRRRNTN